MNYDNNNSNSIGSRIKRIRKSLGMSQEEFAKPLGLTKAAISTYENDQRVPSSSTMNCISYCYNINIEYLKNGKGYMYTNIPNTSIEAIASRYHLDKLSKNIVNKYLSLSIQDRTAFNKYLTEIINLIHTTEEDAGTDKKE